MTTEDRIKKIERVYRSSRGQKFYCYCVIRRCNIILAGI